MPQEVKERRGAEMVKKYKGFPMISHDMQQKEGKTNLNLLGEQKAPCVTC